MTLIGEFGFLNPCFFSPFFFPFLCQILVQGNFFSNPFFIFFISFDALSLNSYLHTSKRNIKCGQGCSTALPWGYSQGSPVGHWDLGHGPSTIKPETSKNTSLLLTKTTMKMYFLRCLSCRVLYFLTFLFLLFLFYFVFCFLHDNIFLCTLTIIFCICCDKHEYQKTSKGGVSAKLDSHDFNVEIDQKELINDKWHSKEIPKEKGDLFGACMFGP